ncbi:MAG: DUF4845 domain-containing protein [Pseudomonadota bacterium]
MRTSLTHQAGLGLLAILIIAMMTGFFVMAGIKIAPGYVEYQQIRSAVIRAAKEYDEDEDTISDIRRSLSSFFTTNQIYRIDYRDVIIERREGRIVIDANFEDRIPLLWRIDAVVKYDDLQFIAGEDYGD